MQHDTPTTCSEQCPPLPTERNRFFTGKYMTARDFRAEQAYLVGRHRLHNRLLHGWGVVCGFGVTRHPAPGCDDWVVVGPGIAMDCCGRELVLADSVPLRVPLPADRDHAVRTDTGGDDGGGREADGEGEEAGAQEDHGEEYDADRDDDGVDDNGHEDDGNEEEPAFAVVLCARYCEEKIEHVPVVTDDHGCDPHRKEPNRVREGVVLTFAPLANLDPTCWRQPAGGGTHCRDDCDDELPATGGGCLEPDCVCGGCVPLALLTLDADGGLDIDTRGRRRLPPTESALTHVTATSWVHGGTMSLEDLADAGALRLRFDRRIAPADGSATGINRDTFLVEHLGEDDDLEFVPYDLDHPPQLVDDCRAVYRIDPSFLDARRRGGLQGSTIIVTLLGDFVLDCHNLPIDADHLAGRLPSGNGTPGGTFRSWFRIVGDEYKETAS